MRKGMKESAKKAIRGLEENVMPFFYGADETGDQSTNGYILAHFEGKNFYNFFSLGDKLGEGISTECFKGTAKERGGPGDSGEKPTTVYAIKRARKRRLRRLGHEHDLENEPVDMWNVGCMAYILLSGSHPFQERNVVTMFVRVAAVDYGFDSVVWTTVSDDAKDFIRRLLTANPDHRMAAEEARTHPWLVAADESLEVHDLASTLTNLRVFDAKRKLRTAVKTVLAARGMIEKLQPAQARDGFSGTWTLGDKLSDGAFGAVFRATPTSGAGDGSESKSDTTVPRSYAVKRFPKEGKDELFAQQVVNEAIALRELDHPNVVRMYDFFENEPGYFFMVLEMMEGGELLHRVVQKQYYSEAEARDVCIVILDILKYIHIQGIVHRDVHPENLLLASADDDTGIKLAGFGLAGSVRAGRLRDPWGTPGYKAPEILRGDFYGTSVDMWSFGVCVYVLLGGYHPFYGSSDDEPREDRAVEGRFEFHEHYWGEVSDEAKGFVRKLLTVDPETRLTADDARQHPWLSVSRSSLSSRNLSASLENLQTFAAKRKLRGVVKLVAAAKRLDLGPEAPAV